MERHTDAQQEQQLLSDRSSHVFQKLESRYDHVSLSEWRPGGSNTEFLGDRDYWVRVHNLGGTDMTRNLRDIHSPCFTWTHQNPLVIFNIDEIPDDELDILMAEEFLHATGVRTSLRVPAWEEISPEAAQELGRHAMEKFTVYFACSALGVLDYPYLPKNIMHNLQAEVNHAAIIGRFLEVGESFDPQMLVKMCATGDVSEFISYYNCQYSMVEIDGSIDPASQLLLLAALLNKFEVSDDEEEVSVIREQLDILMNTFLEAYTKIYQVR
ncbi:hypothetical protein KBD81_00810 [Candidatus Woesebacteria bacterium]|nr:hypothetical protein [Candidatus Woesebacteria bacterium]